MEEIEKRETRYFWSGWFDGQSFRLLAAVFVLFSFVDLLATIRTMAVGVVKEGNALADAVLKHYGNPGFIVYKLLLVLLILGTTWIVNRTNPRLAHGVLWGGILLMAVITLCHLAIIVTFSGL